MCWGRIILASMFCLMLASCGSKISGMSDEDLQDKVHACNIAVSQSPGFAISCDNYRRECTSRSEAGRYVC